MMDFETDLLGDYFKENNEAMMDILYQLDSIDGWQLIILELRKFRIPVYVKQELVERAKSPSYFLIHELIQRSCTVSDFKDILKRCNLLDTLSILEEPDPPKIITQPGEDYEKVFVFFGDDLKLECVATGVPPPTYQWFCGNVPLTGHNSSVMILPDFREQNEGEYYCIVSQCTKDCVIEVTSNIIVCTLLESLPEFVHHLPRTLAYKVGSEIKLKLEISCRSNYKIEWIKNNQILDGEHDCTLILKNINKSDAGTYRCVAKNLAGEVFSDECRVDVIPENRKRKASVKVALLIANRKYDNFSHLQTPIEDCLLLAEKLEKLNFHVITLIDLTLQEMHNCINWFFENLPPKAYAFVCYIGHGFSIANNKFMMPVDCPEENKYRMGDCILDELVIKKAVESKVTLLVNVLDMCLKEPNRESAIYQDILPDHSYTPHPSFRKVQAFATSNYQGAYESPYMKHGFYIPCVSMYLESDKTVTQVLELAHEEFLKNKVVELQKPLLSFSADAILFKLTDAVEENFESQDRFPPFTNIKETLKYEHELCFPGINLNTTLLATPHRGKILNAIDLKFTQSLFNEYDVTSLASPQALGYDWTSSTENDDKLLTLYNIQKVKTNIYITVWLSDATGSEKRVASIDNDIDLGLPLIASTNYWLEKKHLRS